MVTQIESAAQLEKERKNSQLQATCSHPTTQNDCPNENEKKNKQKFCNESDKWNAISSISDDDSMLRLTE